MKYPNKPSGDWYLHWQLFCWSDEPYRYNYVWRNFINENVGSMGNEHPYWGA